MYLYNISKGTPEGNDWDYTYTHEKKFTKDEFADIVESLYVQVIKENIEEEKKIRDPDDDYHMSLAGSMDNYSMDHKDVPQLMLEKGFKPIVIEQSHHAEPYWGWERFKNKELLQMFTDEHNQREEMIKAREEKEKSDE